MNFENTIFRTAIPVNEPATSPVEQRNEPNPIPVTFTTEERPAEISNVPKVVTVLNIGEAKDHFQMPSLINEINDFVLDDLKRNDLDGSTKNYEACINKYLSRLNLPTDIDIYTKIENLAELMKIDKKLLESLEDRKRILEADITELTGDELRRRIELDESISIDKSILKEVIKKKDDFAKGRFSQEQMKGAL